VPLTYQPYLVSGGIAVWAPAQGLIDHLFVWAGNQPAAPASLSALLTQWNDAPVTVGGVRQRSIYFCQSFADAGSKNALAVFLGSAVAANTWGKLAYWQSLTFTGGSPDARFPNGQAGPIEMGSVALVIDGDVPTSLENFQVSADPDGTSLDLLLNSANDFTWSIGSAAGVLKGALHVPLQPLAGFVAGAISLAGTCPKNLPQDHPVRRTRFLYQADPQPLPQAGQGPVQCRTWFSELTDAIDAPAGLDGPRCPIMLDPRDGLQPGWLNGLEFNSRIEFGTAAIHTSFYGAKGQRFSINGNGTGVARMGVISDVMQEDHTISAGVDVVFHPENPVGSPFQIVGKTPDPALPAASALNVSGLDMVAGSAATEFFDLANATHIHFEKRKPAYFLENEIAAPGDKQIFDPTKNVAVTSYVQILNNGVSVDYHSQPAEAPLFNGTAASLVRYRQPIGTMRVPMPLFPRAGFQAPSGTGTPDDILDLEASNLALFRRNHAKVPVAPLASAAAPAPVQPTQLAVTPQGLLAAVAADGSYTNLYFGNPDSQTPRVDFSLRICNGNAKRYADVQKALAANHLFLVFRNASPDALRTIAPSAQIQIGEFSFSIGPGDLNASSLCAGVTQQMKASVLLVKYFTNKSLDDLVKNPALWACQTDLAPADAGGFEALTKAVKVLTDLGAAPGQITDPLLKDLDSVWFDRSWQGALALNVPTPGLPDIIAALQPGLSPDEPGLIAHHFGINAVPVRQQDLKPIPAGGQPNPMRTGSAFGLIQYGLTGSMRQPGTPTIIDHEPGTPVPDPTQPPPRTYGLIVDTLNIAIANSQISLFQAAVRIQFDHLFWDGVTGDGGANTLKSITLNGSYEKRDLGGGKSGDVFSLVSPGPIEIDFSADSFISKLTVTRAQLNVLSKDSGGNLNVFVGLKGGLQLNNAKIPQIPLFSVKEIDVSSFGFQYQTNPFTFKFVADGISAVIDFTPGTPVPLLSFLPAKLKGMTIAISDLIDIHDDLHFQPLLIGGASATKLHFGFLLDLDLGSIGQLSGDSDGFHIPFLIGWAGGSNKGLALGIQFPSYNAPVDIGIQQFIRLQAEKLQVKTCTADGSLTAIAIQAVDARVVMFGKKWPPDTDVSFLIFIPLGNDHRPSWAFSIKQDTTWYVAGGYRINIDTNQAKDFDDVKAAYAVLDTVTPDTDICALKSKATPPLELWNVVAQYSDDFTLGVAVSDPNVYACKVTILDFTLQLLYRRVNSQLGIFSIEFTLPGELREMQFGAATVRLPVFRLEIHTDGGFLADFGFPWNNDFSRSAQVEVGIFLGSGGFYYGLTSAAAADLLAFPGGYNYFPPDSLVLNRIRTVQLGFEARVGIGRSFTIGILNAEASLTIFGGLEGAVGYGVGSAVFSPTLYAFKGFVGLMLDISATVSFAIIQASARILAYADVGLEIRRVLVRKTSSPTDPNHYMVILPVVVFADIGLTVSVDVQIHIGCISVSIHLSFSATWHFEETLIGISSPQPYNGAPAIAAASHFALAPAATWSTAYQYWTGTRGLTVYATVIPCMANAADVSAAANTPSVVGLMMLPADPPANGFGDLARFLIGWVLLDPATVSGNPADYDALPITLGKVVGVQNAAADKPFWTAFPAALLTVVGNQFIPNLTNLTNGQDEPFAVIPPWPGFSFIYLPAGVPPLSTAPVQVPNTDAHIAMPADQSAFTEYCHHLIVATLLEIKLLLQNDTGANNANLDRNDPNRFLTWSGIWNSMFRQL
jgi:hypothetical protein